MIRLKAILFLLFLFSIQITFSQKERIETALFRCYSSSTSGKIDSVKILMKDFEDYLIKQKILKSSNGQGYRGVIELIYENPDTIFNNDFNFIYKVQNIEGSFNDPVINCLDTVMRSDNYDRSKIEQLDGLFQQLDTSSIMIKSISEKILKVFDIKDFEMPYYKFATLLLIDSFSIERLSYLNDLEEKNKVLPNEKPIKIFLNKTLLTVEGKKSTIQEMKKLVNEHYYKYQEKAVVLFGSTRETLYKDYVNILNTIEEEIKRIRDEYSKKKYGKAFEELKKELQEQIDKKIQIKIIESIPID